MPDYGVAGPTRRYALIVGMLVALATVPTLVVLAVGAAWVGDRHSGGTPPRGASTGDPVIVLSRPPAGPRVADNVAVPPVAPTTSPAYNVILPMIGAVVTDRGGALSHSAIIAREFGIPAVVGTDQATSRVPDGARILVDGDRGFVAVRS